MTKLVKKILPNGLTVLLQESHAAPVVSFHVWARVGSAQETDDIAGICHLIEHMIFKGTSRRAVGQISKEVEAAGGDINAYTSFDETVFYLQMPAANYRVGLDILADATSDPTFDATELAREKEVVVEEINRAEDNPSQMVSEDLFTTAYTTHTYRRPIAGDRNTVRAVSRETLLNFYRKWYVGSNLIFIGVGDFDSKKILPVIESLYSKIPSGKAPVVISPAEPEKNRPRAVHRAMAIEGYYLDLALPIPAVTHADVPALDLLSHILGGGASARLEQVVKEKKGLVASIGSSAYTPKDPGLLVVGATLRDNNIDKTLPAIWEEMTRLKEGPISAVEIIRAKNNIRSSRIYEKQTVSGLARKLGFFEGTAGDHAFEESYYRRVQEVTGEDLLNVAQKYFRAERLTLSLCHPQKDRCDEQELSGLLEKLTRSKPGVSTPAPRDQITSFRLKNGIRVVLKPDHELPLVAIRSASQGGLRAEDGRVNGVAHLTALVQNKGTVHRTAREIVEESENFCGHMESYTGKNMIGLQGSFLSEYLTEGLDLFSDLLCHPSFPEQEIEKEKRHTLTAIRNEEDSMTSLAMKQFFKTLYPKHPYGLPLLGTKASVKQIRRRQLQAYYARVVRPENLVLSFVGDFEVEDLRERLQEKLGPWRIPGSYRAPRLTAPVSPIRALQVELKKEKFQAHIVLGFLGTTLKHRDRFALDVLNSILSGMGGRLFMELRDKNGLCYTVTSSHQEGVDPGIFMIYMGTDPAKFETALPGIYQEVERIKEGVTSEELERAKRCITGNYTLDLQKSSSVAGLLAHNALFGLPLALTSYPHAIDLVTASEVQRVAQKYLRLEKSVLSVIRP